MYASASTQQPAAICALKSPADAIHVLEAVRVGLVPRVTRRLTGHERAQIRPGTVWVWEEEETNMRRWTDGRRWGASRVGGGGFLVYTESSESHSPPSARSDSPNKFGYPNGFYPTNPHHEPLVKQTYSTSMTHPVTGKLKKFHVVGYSSKHNPQGDAHNPLPLPHQLPLLANLVVPPGIWPEWERRRDGAGTEGGNGAGNTGGAAKKGSSSAGSRTPAPPPQQSPETPLSAFASSGYPSRTPSAAPPSYSVDPRAGPQGAYNTPYYYPPPSGRSTQPYPPALPPPHQMNDRYHPYRDRPGGAYAQPPPSDASGVPLVSPPLTDGYDDRRTSGSSSLAVPPQHSGQQGSTAPLPGPSPYNFPQGAPPAGSNLGGSPYGNPYRDPYRRDPYNDDTSRSTYHSQMMPPSTFPSSGPQPTNVMNHNYHYGQPQPMQTPPQLPPQQSQMQQQQQQQQHSSSPSLPSGAPTMQAQLSHQNIPQSHPTQHPHSQSQQSDTSDHNSNRNYLPRQPSQPSFPPGNNNNNNSDYQQGLLPSNNRSPKFSISSALSGESNPGGFTLPPLRVAIDDNNGRLSPGGHAVKTSPGNSPSGGLDSRREIGDLGKKVSL